MMPKHLNDAYQRIDFDRELVYRFFVSFSLFEKALKEASFRTVRKQIISPDWKRFAESIHERFIEVKEADSHFDLRVAVGYLLTYPPKIQIVNQEAIEVIDTERNTDNETVWLSVLIRTVRNNLFHGGKFSFDRPRDTLLIQSSLIILEAWAVINPRICEIIDEVR